MEKPAETIHSINNLLARRWSPRSFASQPVEPEKLQSIFEAARWAASSFNEQPWRFILATQQNPEQFQTALSCLVEANQAWASNAPVLILTLTTDRFSRNDNPNRCALHDLGLATANLSIQALELGLFVHHMAGINISKIKTIYNIPDNVTPQTAIALGYPDLAENLPEDWMRDSEKAPRTRNPFSHFIFENSYDHPSHLFNK
ncbi:nitroreductase family protein [Planctomycetota bacterium]|nr:nitroreductase family protein [Planctomycetota bacterium]